MMKSSFIFGSVLVILIAGNLYGQDFTFVELSQYGVDPKPNCVRPADLNNDGFLDLVTANSGGSHLSVLINDGAGGFNTAVHYTAGPGARDIALADFNGDTFIDIAVANFGFDSISVVLNNGDGTFSAPTNYLAAHNNSNSSRCRSMFIEALDINNDSLPDLVVSVTNNYYDAVTSDKVYIFMNNGDGSFQYIARLKVDDDPSEICSGDFNSDGKIDFAVACQWSKVNVFLNRGDSTFSRSAYAAHWMPYNICAVDLDGDTDLDFAVTNMDSRDVTVMRNNGAGVFTAISHTSISYYPNSIFAGDFDNDNDQDILVSTTSGTYVSILANNGSGGLSSRTNIITGGSPSYASAGDFDGDGDNDLAVADRSTDNVVIMSNTTYEEPIDRLFHSYTDWSIQGAQPFDVCVADFNGDGQDDLVFSTYSLMATSVYAANFWLLVHEPGGNTNMSTVMDWYASSDDPFLNVSAADLDGDRFIDLVASDITKTASALNKGAGTFYPHNPIYNRVGAIALGNLDDSNGPDMVVGNDSLWVTLNDGVGSFSDLVGFDTDNTVKNIVIADINNDSLSDVIAAHGHLSVLFNNGDSTFQNVAISIAGPGVEAVCAADLNSDGWTDLITVNNSPVMSVFLNNGDGTFLTRVDYATGGSPSSICAADIDDDGNLDLAVANRGSDDVSVFLNNSEGVFTPAGRYRVGREPRSICALDFDGDNDIDLAIATHGGTAPFATGKLCILYNKLNIPTGITDGTTISVLPSEYRLSQNYPNPFNPTTTIAYHLPSRSHVSLQVYNILGQAVKTLVNRELPAGSYIAEWDGSDYSGHIVATGIYLYRLRAGDYTNSKQMLFVK